MEIKSYFLICIAALSAGLSTGYAIGKSSLEDVTDKMIVICKQKMTEAVREAVQSGYDMCRSEQTGEM